MLFIHAQLSSSAKQAVCSIALVQWYDYVCHCLQKPPIRHSLNAEILQFCQRLGAAPLDPLIWDCLLGQIRTPLLKFLRTGLFMYNILVCFKM